MTVKVVLFEEDIPADIRIQIERESAQTEVLGSGNVQAFLFEAVPKIVAKKLRRMTPEGFMLSEMSMNFALEGDFKIAKISGSVNAVFRPVEEEKDE